MHLLIGSLVNRKVKQSQKISIFRVDSLIRGVIHPATKEGRENKNDFVGYISKVEGVIYSQGN